LACSPWPDPVRNRPSVIDAGAFLHASMKLADRAGYLA
jgi:hypothetical protein